VSVVAAKVPSVDAVRPWHAFARRAMGSPLRLLLVGLDEEEAAAAWEVVSDDIEVSEATMSRFRPTSELTALNGAAGRPVTVSPRLYRAVAAARRAWRLTDGSFDPRVASDLERLGYRSAALPGPGTASAATDRGDPAETPSGAASRTGVRARDRAERAWMRADPFAHALEIEEPIDLGGIGKGLALRWAWHAMALAMPHVGGALLEAGGDMICGGLPAVGDRWEILIDDPMAPGTPVAAVAIGGGGISTSGSTMNRWAAPDRSVVHHLIDPRTGSPVDRGILQVTVAGPDPAWTEVWCKALYLAGAADVEREARRRGLAAWWVEEDGTFRMTPLARLVTTRTTRG
jgi:thiamine biosynthesis lipoprotein